MREYLFRGRTTSGYWVYGSLIHVENYCCILEHDKQDSYDAAYLDSQIGWIDGCATPIDPKTVGQYTGLKDKNGTKIFEGDIVQEVEDETELHAVTCRKGRCFPFAAYYDHTCLDGDDCIVVGNIHDNPELLEEP